MPFLACVNDTRKSLIWIGSTRRDLRKFPEDVRRVFGFTLHLAQKGDKHLDAKPLRGFCGAGVLEVVEDFDGSTYRAVYTVKFAGVVYALHAFQKKAIRGIAIPKQEIELVRKRLRSAEDDYRARAKEMEDGTK